MSVTTKAIMMLARLAEPFLALKAEYNVEVSGFKTQVSRLREGGHNCKAERAEM